MELILKHINDRMLDLQCNHWNYHGKGSIDYRGRMNELVRLKKKINKTK